MHGGRSRQLPGFLGMPAVEAQPEHEVAAFLRRARTGEASSAASPAPAAEQQLVSVQPAGHWRLGMLAPVDATYISWIWRDTYVASGVQDVIRAIVSGVAQTRGINTTKGRVTIVTGFAFMAEALGIGAVPALLPDNALYAQVVFNFKVQGGPSFKSYHNMTEYTGGFLNRGLENSPIEMYLPGGTRLIATYEQIATPNVTPTNIYFTMRGWEIDETIFYKHIAGSTR